jgi:iron(III) transport system permease protein
VQLTIPLWIAVGCIGFVLVPWYGLEDGILRTPLSDYLRSDAAPGLLQALNFGRWWLLPLAVALLAPVLTLRRERDDRTMATLLIAAGTFGLAWLFIQGFALTHRGWGWSWLPSIFGPTKLRQFGLGWGAALVGAAFLFYLTCGLARRGAMRGDEFVTGAIGLVVATVALFVFWPVTEVLFEAAITPQGGYAFTPLADRLSTQTIWGLGCFPRRAILRRVLELDPARDHRRRSRPPRSASPSRCWRTAPTSRPSRCCA